MKIPRANPCVKNCGASEGATRGSFLTYSMYMGASSKAKPPNLREGFCSPLSSSVTKKARAMPSLPLPFLSAARVTAMVVGGRAILTILLNRGRREDGLVRGRARGGRSGHGWAMDRLRLEAGALKLRIGTDG
eukprot:scaffold257794_cov32-Tisochrysis_lutea.AAC.1